MLTYIRMSETTEPVAYRKKGSLELELQIKCLPPTPITENALMDLKTMGVSEMHIEMIREYSATFRYDLCLEKVQRLVAQPVELSRIGDQEVLNFPHFFDLGSRFDGQCGDIAEQWLIHFNNSGLLSIINASLPVNRKLVLGIHQGQSRTHFCQEGSVHFWNSVVLTSSSGTIITKVYFDVAFQQIMNVNESGYEVKTSWYDPNLLTRKSNAIISMGAVTTTDSAGQYVWSAKIINAIVLGVSSDFKLSYLLTYARNAQNGEITPIISCISSNGTRADYLFGPDHRFLASSGSRLEDHHLQEVGELLNTATKLEITESPPTILESTWTLS